MAICRCHVINWVPSLVHKIKCRAPSIPTINIDTIETAPKLWVTLSTWKITNPNWVVVIYPMDNFISLLNNRTTLFSFIFAGLKFRENFFGTFRESLISRSRRNIVFAGNLISRNWRLSDFFFFFYKNCTLMKSWNKTNMMSLSVSCIPLKVAKSQS